MKIIDNARLKPLRHIKDNFFTNIVYDEKYSVPEANLYRGINGDFFQYPNDLLLNWNPEKTISGISVYLGILDVHYGHAISEGLSRLHGFNIEEIDNFIFSFTNVNHKNNISKNPIYYKLIKNLEKHGNIIYIDQDIECEKLLIPEQNFILGLYCKKDNCLINKVFESNETKNKNSKIYLSRKKINDDRKFYDESFVEEKLLDKGFEIIYPEDMSLDEQISLFRNTSFICGMEGTALLNVIWSRNQQLKLMSVGFRNQRNKAQKDLCNAKKIPFKLLNMNRINSESEIVNEILCFSQQKG